MQKTPPNQYFIQYRSNEGRFEVRSEVKGRTESHPLDGGKGLPPITIRHAAYHARREGFDTVEFWREDDGPLRRIPMI